jgi:hypothetical protein
MDSTLLSKVGDGVWKADSQYCVKCSDVNSKLQGAGTDNTNQLAVKHFSFNLASILRRITTSIRHYPSQYFCSLKIRQFRLDRREQCFTLLPHSTKRDSSNTPEHKLAKQLRRFGHTVTSTRGRVTRVFERGVPAQELLATGRRPIKICQLDFIDTEYSPHMLLGVSHSSRTRNKLDVTVSHRRTYPSQTPHDESHVCAKQPIVDVQFVDDHKSKVLQERSPCIFLRQDGNVEHIRVCENDPSFISDVISFSHGCIAVECLNEDFFQTSHEAKKLFHTLPLILC